MMDAVSIAQAAGLSPELAAYMPRYVHIESGGDPNAVTGSYSGLLQMGPDEAKKYGGNDLSSGARMYADNANWFQSKYNRPPSPTELYMVAQQGRGGIASHMANPDAPAWQNMLNTAEGQEKGAGWAKRAIWGNVPDAMKKLYGSVDNITSGDFINNIWKSKVEQSPMAAAMRPQQQEQGNAMPSQKDPSLYSRVVAGGPGALFGAPGGVFPGADGGEGGGYDLGLALSRAGAAITSIANPSGGAAMMNAANMPLFRQRYSVVSDSLGRQHVFDVRTGQFIQPGAAQVGGRAQTSAGLPGARAMPVASATGSSSGLAADAVPEGAGDLQSVIQNSPKGLEAAATAGAESDQKKLDALEEAAGNAQDVKDLIEQQAMPLSKNPDVYQGAGADWWLTGKKVLRGAAGLTGVGQGPQGTVETADLDKVNRQLQAKMLAAQKGVRFAAPEIKFGEAANADLDKPAETNQQIYSNAKQQAERVLYAASLARQYKAQGLSLGPSYHAALQHYYDAHPIYKMDQIPGGGAGGSKRPPLSSFNQ